jgi:predicted nucleic acid-binding protein
MYLLDTNVVIDYLNNSLPSAATIFLDRVIAATALTKNFTLISRNIKDFSIIKELQLLNPFDIK